MTATDIPSDPSGDEETSLLSAARPPMPTRQPSLIREAHSPRVIFGIILAVVFIIDFGGNLLTVPSIRLYEDIICHHYYDGIGGDGHIGLAEPIDEALCKGDEVQNKLNVFLAVLQFLASACSTLPSRFPCFGNG